MYNHKAKIGSSFVLPFCSYQLDINVDRAADVLVHQKVLAEAKDPDRRPAFHVRFLRVKLLLMLVWTVLQATNVRYATMVATFSGYLLDSSHLGPPQSLTARVFVPNEFCYISNVNHHVVVQLSLHDLNEGFWIKKENIVMVKIHCAQLIVRKNAVECSCPMSLD